MQPIAHIRQHVFRLPQAAFAEIAGVTQPTISRWERGDWSPGHVEMERIRKAAVERGIDWQDRWFWEPPLVSEGEAA